MMATLLSAPQDMFGPGPFGTHAYTPAPGGGSSADGPLHRPGSPPQPIPRPRQQQQAFGPAPTAWEDAHEVSASPASSVATENFLDAFSELPSASSSYGAEADSSAAAVDELILQGTHSRLALPDTIAAAVAAAAAAAATGAAAPVPSPAGSSPAAGAAPSLLAQLAQEQRRRQAAEAAGGALRRQLDEMSALLFSYQRQQTAGSAEDLASEAPSASSPATVLRAVLEEAAAARQAAAEAAPGAAEDAAYVARLVAGVCARAAAAADLGAAWEAERLVLERRLQQAARMGEAMLKHQKEQSGVPEPWRQQLVNAVILTTCAGAGALAAFLVLKRSQV